MRMGDWAQKQAGKGKLGKLSWQIPVSDFAKFFQQFFLQFWFDRFKVTYK